MTANKDGFTLNFTEPVDPATASNPASYAMDAFIYIFKSEYGSDQVDQATPKITAATVSTDKKSVRLKVDGLIRGHIHHLVAKGVKSATAQTLWHPETWYTLNEIPK
jgi:UDP-2,3-diacylglucosamine pyrophosphatase LpxH